MHHKDGNRGNDHISNLEYVTQTKSTCYSHTSGKRRCGGSVWSKPVMYRALGSKDWTMCTFIAAAAFELSVSPGAVSHACHHVAPLEGYEIQFSEMQQPDWPGEEWRPLSGVEVAGRMVSSLGRLKKGMEAGFTTGASAMATLHCHIQHLLACEPMTSTDSLRLPNFGTSSKPATLACQL